MNSDQTKPEKPPLPPALSGPAQPPLGRIYLKPFNPTGWCLFFTLVAFAAAIAFVCCLVAGADATAYRLFDDRSPLHKAVNSLQESAWVVGAVLCAGIVVLSLLGMLLAMIAHYVSILSIPQREEELDREIAEAKTRRQGQSHRKELLASRLQQRRIEKAQAALAAKRARHASPHAGSI